MAFYFYNTLKRSLYFFAILGVVFIPNRLFPGQQQLSDLVFKPLLELILQSIFSVRLINPGISSDSALMYILVLVLFLMALLFSLLPVSAPFLAKCRTAFSGFLLFYLGLQMASYGFDKVFKSQFYMPEPNILYTPFGQLDQDILYWSMIGTSYSYSLFTGIAEVLSAVLMLFRRTRAAGLFLSVFLLLNILSINLCFDISVKLYSSFLLLINVLLLWSYLKTLYRLFVLHLPVEPPTKTNTDFLSTPPIVRHGFNALAVIYIFSATLFPFIEHGHFNDDKIPRPYLHGAYELREVRMNGSVAALDNISVKRVFIHRHGFLIFQDIHEGLEDFKLDIDSVGQKLILTDYDLRSIRLRFTYSLPDSLLQLQYFEKNKEYLLTLKALDWRNLPALQNQFNLTMDIE